MSFNILYLIKHWFMAKQECSIVLVALFPPISVVAEASTSLLLYSLIGSVKESYVV